MVLTDLDPKDVKSFTSRAEKFSVELLFEFVVDHDGEFTRSELRDAFAEESKWEKRTVYSKIAELIKAKRLFVSKVDKNINVTSPRKKYAK
jgi:hypothetical protein